ncbi:urease accessory protein UreF [Marinobacterium sedimentorum]|jgi:urease accessory protein|uniref:urease accessory protein UreF n=1 Tax=Marinobacterium sedimentorum TaxID=2927804 RepID=UPI0020C729E0|nr:urease accessory protein UreF [Marinobacterium sedimentorum]MCP8687103.1 urease accessory protein UreF [Marinobacterium sedimentorum]
MLPDLRLYQLTSPSLPVGGFTYSQGLEWAIERGWVTSSESLGDWLESVLEHSLVTLELPLLSRLHAAFGQQDKARVEEYCQWLLCCRETRELRQEERQRGAALATLLPNLGIEISPELAETLRSTQLAGFALAAVRWDIAPRDALLGFCWSWLEAGVMAGVKLVPLGQTAGQQLLLRLSEIVPAALERALGIDDDHIGSSTLALAIASSRHETQYTRLFRS